MPGGPVGFPGGALGLPGGAVGLRLGFPPSVGVGPLVPTGAGGALLLGAAVLEGAALLAEGPGVGNVGGVEGDEPDVAGAVVVLDTAMVMRAVGVA